MLAYPMEPQSIQRALAGIPSRSTDRVADISLE
eukprot:Gb_07482 [translate_table: standard]